MCYPLQDSFRGLHTSAVYVLPVIHIRHTLTLSRFLVDYSTTMPVFQTKGCSAVEETLTVPLFIPLIIIYTAPAAVGISLDSASGRYRALLGEVREND
jgi:hypothetical protein